MTIDMGDSRVDTINVHEGDDVFELARMFQEKHHLIENVIAPLAKEIKSNVESVLESRIRRRSEPSWPSTDNAGDRKAEENQPSDDIETQPKKTNQGVQDPALTVSMLNSSNANPKEANVYDEDFGKFVKKFGNIGLGQVHLISYHSCLSFC